MIRLGVALVALVAFWTASVSADSFDAIDTDSNGLISDAEAQAAGRALFQRLDVDGDGRLSSNEVGGRLGAPMFKAADPDNDGTLDAEEYAAIVTARFKSANTNGDGAVDRQEFVALPGTLLAIVITENVAAPSEEPRK